MQVNSLEGDRWAELADLLGRVLCRGPLTLDEACAAFEAAPEVLLSGEEIRSIVSRQHTPLCRSRTTSSRQPRALRHEHLEQRELLAPLLPIFAFV